MSVPNKAVFTVLAAILCTSSSFAQQGSGIPSPQDKAEVELKGKTVTIVYSRPSIRGRKIFGALVPYDQVWRTGANEATSLSTPIDLMIGKLAVPAGNYTIFTVPGEKLSKLIINKQTGQWGTDYNQANDLGRVDLKKTAPDKTIDQFTIRFEKNGDEAQLILEWENTRLSVPVRAK